MGKPRSIENCNEESVTAYKSERSNAPIHGKTPAQFDLISAGKRSTVIFVTGPAGTGKTWVPSAMAADAIAAGDIDRVFITRPTVQCGERVGELPGTALEKFAPYAFPVIDVFNTRLGKRHVENLIRNDRIVQMQLQYMRGSSIDNAWILADEMQNATPEQLKMLLTRIGRNCKLFINGDINQADMRDSGLQHAIKTVVRVEGIEHIKFTTDDIVRSGIVKDIVLAYEE